MMHDRNSTVPAVNRHISTRLIADEAFLMNLETLETYVLNDTAARVWSLIDNTRSVGDMVTALLAEYNISERECTSAVHSLLHDFAESGLITYDSDR